MKVKIEKQETKNRFNNMKEKDWELFHKMLVAETISGEEHILRDLFVEELTQRGFSVEVDRIGNIAATRGEGPKVMLNAHMDIINISHYFSGYSYSSGYSNWYSESAPEPDYPHDYNFYTEISDIIAECKAECLSDEEAAKTALEDLELYLAQFTPFDYKSIGVDCVHCHNACKSLLTCNNFTPCKDDYSIIEFIDLLEEYVNVAIEDFVNYEDSCFNYEEDTVEEYIEEESRISDNFKVVMDFDNDKIYGKGKYRVLGGDDKCGCMIALKVAELLPNIPMKILFTVQEEVGCVGIQNFIEHSPNFFDDVRYSLTIDRRDGDNLLPKQLGVRSCSDEFTAKLGAIGVSNGIPIKVMNGNIADVIHIRDLVPNSVNMSAGYYNAHTSDEYVKPSDIDRIISWAINIVKEV